MITLLKRINHTESAALGERGTTGWRPQAIKLEVGPATHRSYKPYRSYIPLLFLTVALSVVLSAFSARAARLKDLCEVDGARENMLKGVGIVVGLSGTGDGTRAAIIAQERMLRRMSVEIKDIKELASDNAAIVAVTATIPPYAKEGTRIDVKVSSIYDAKSLEGGTLLETYLTGPGSDETVYAVAQGAVSVGGFAAGGGGGGTGVRQNHVTAGRIPMGAYVEREVPSTITDGQRIKLLLKQPDFTTASTIQQAIDSALGSQAASALGAGTILVTIPEAQQADLVRFIA
ncbi:MAG: flagellar basal body P-ring protein FlgI, partial [Candidatus Hydrogenedentes bacterium]|nr:flagellar basal body P-ring protein FlgI [Candidatus Hydrogenedentota bacterium]